MPLDGITLGSIARELSRKLENGRVDRVQQPEADEILLTLRAGGQNHRLLLSSSANFARVHLTQQPRKSPDTPPMFCMLLRKYLGSARVLGMEQLGCDRVLHLRFESLNELGDVVERRLIIEIMGRHSNIMLVENTKILACARNVTRDVSRVREVLPGLLYEAPPAQDKLDPLQCEVGALASRLTAMSDNLLCKALQSALSGLSMQLSRELAYRLAGDEEAPMRAVDPFDAAGDALSFLRALPQMEQASLFLSPAHNPLDVTSFLYASRDASMQRAYPSISEALDEFYRLRDQSDRIKQRSASLRQSLKSALERCENKLAHQLETQQKTQKMDTLRIYADLIIASIAQIPKGAATADLVNYYDPAMASTTIALDPALSAKDNAQRYYKQYNKLKTASKMVDGQMATNKAEIDYLQAQLHYLDNCETLGELDEIRDELVREGYRRTTSSDKKRKGKAQQAAASRPLLFLSDDGTEIYVGKNNAQNDRLTRDADGNDHWLHTKDIPGSHVIVRSAAPSDRTLTQAAQLAAHYSKARDGQLVPVDIAQRKYVKKPSGARPGFVIYTHQRTVYIAPDKEAAKPVV